MLKTLLGIAKDRRPALLVSTLVLFGCNPAAPVKVSHIESSSGKAFDIVVTEKVTAASQLSEEPWPFPVPEVEIFCAKYGFDVFGFSGKFGALNDRMTVFADKGFTVVLSDGRRVPIVGVSDDTRNLIRAGLTRSDAEVAPINLWTNAMNQRLSACW